MTPEHKTIKGIIKGAVDNVKQCDQLAPVFFVGGESGTQIIMTQFSNPEEKQLAAMAVKTIAADTNADFVLFIAESYTFKDQAAAMDYMDNREKYKNSMENHPKAVEVVMFMLETKQKCWTGIADILPGRNLGETLWKETPGIEGTFSNLLGDKPALN